MDYEIQSSYNELKKMWEVKVSGEIDIFNSNDFKDKINRLLDEKPADLHLDCGYLKYIDSTALGALVAILKRVKSYDGNVYLANVNSNMNRLLKITKLDKSFTIAGGRE